MIVQLDIDGTIDQAPQFYAWLSQSLRRDGHTVLIVTSRTTSPANVKITAKELRGYGVVYDKLLLSPEVADLDPRRLPPDLHPAHRIFASKLMAAEDHGVQILFDDDGVVAELFQRYLPTVTVLKPIRKR